jgi:hypothetical protein
MQSGAHTHSVFERKPAPDLIRGGSVRVKKTRQNKEQSPVLIKSEPGSALVPTRFLHANRCHLAQKRDGYARRSAFGQILSKEGLPRLP